MSYRVEIRKEFVGRIARCLTKIEICIEFVMRIVRCLNKLRAVRSLLGEL